MQDHLYLAHHGIKGMKWGVRRFQNADGSLTSAGKQRYGVDGGSGSGSSPKKLTRAARAAYKRADAAQRAYNSSTAKNAKKNAFDREVAEEWREAAKEDPKRKALYDKYYREDMARAKKNAAARKEYDDEWLEIRDDQRKVGDRTQQYHDNAKKYWDNMSTGKKIGTVALYGAFGAQQYVAAKGNGDRTTTAAAKTLISGSLAGPIGHMIVNNLDRGEYARRDD